MRAYKSLSENVRDKNKSFPFIKTKKVNPFRIHKKINLNKLNSLNPFEIQNNTFN